MDLHVYRTSQDRWHHLRSAARERGAVLAVNAVTLDELVQRIVPDVEAASPGQRLAVLQELTLGDWSMSSRYAYDAIAELKAARVRPHELLASGADGLADVLEKYDRMLRQAGIYDPHDRCATAASRINEGGVPWLALFECLG